MNPLLLHVFATFAPAGPQVRTAELVNALGTEFRHAVLAMDGVTGARERVDAGVEFEVLDSLPRAGSVRTALRMRGLLRERRPALVLTYNWGSIDTLIAKRLGLDAPVLHHEDGFLPDEAVQLKRRRVMARRSLLRRTVGLVVPSERLAEIARGPWQQPAERVHCIPNGIHVERFTRGSGNFELRQGFGIPDDAVVIGACGHLRPEKNPLRLLDALALMKERPHLLLVGDGPEREGLEAAARSGVLAGRVHFAGHVEDTAPYYQAMDLFALTSDTEQMPVALLEAMASSLPVVATEVGDVGRMLPEGQENFVIPLSGKGTPVSLAAALDALCVGPTLRERLGNANRVRVQERYSFEAMLDAHASLWRKHAR